MRKIKILPFAERSITAVANYIESKNLPGSSDKWVNELMDLIIHQSTLNITYPLCKNTDLALQGMSCLVYKKKWVIAFRQTARTFTVHYFIYGPKLV